MHSIYTSLSTRDNVPLNAWVVVTLYSAPLPGTRDDPPEPEELEWHLSTRKDGPISEALQYHAGVDHEATHDWLSDKASEEGWGRHRRAA